MKYIIEDEFHAEHILNKEFDSFQDALNEIKSYSKIPWDLAPNKCPCQSWESCHRDYIIIPIEKPEDSTLILTVSSKHKIWH